MLICSFPLPHFVAIICTKCCKRSNINCYCVFRGVRVYHCSPNRWARVFAVFRLFLVVVSVVCMCALVSLRCVSLCVVIHHVTRGSKIVLKKSVRKTVHTHCCFCRGACTCLGPTPRMVSGMFGFGLGVRAPGWGPTHACSSACLGLLT